MVKGDIGTVIDCNMRIDVSAATVLQMKYKKPSGVVGVWAGTLYGTQAVRHITLAGDIDEAGTWTFQPYIETPMWKGHGKQQTAIVGTAL